MERPDLILIIVMSLFSASSYASDTNRIELQQAKTFILKSETDKALDIWKRLAEESDTEAQHQLGMYYLRLGKQSKDKSKAQTWLLKAAESGYIKSQYGLACLFESDNSELYDLDKARYWFEKAAQQGHRQSVKRLKTWDRRHNKKDLTKSGKYLLSAVKRNETGRVISLLKRHADPDTLDSRGKTVLIIAASLGHETVVRMLLKAGADINLLDKEGNNALLSAVYSGHTKIAKHLIEAGSNVNRMNHSGMSALAISARKNYIAITRLLLAGNVQLHQKNSTGKTSIDIAHAAGHEDIVNLLKQAGATPEKQGVADSLSRIDQSFTDKSQAFENWPALNIAAWRQQADETRRLLKQGHNANGVDAAGMIPLQRAVIQGNVEITSLLLLAGSRINHQDKNHRTAISYAAETGNMAVIELLTSNNADVNTFTSIEDSPLYLAILNGNESSALELLNFQKVSKRDIEKILESSASQKMLSMLSVLLKKYHFSAETLTRIMMTAIEHHDASMVDFLISRGISTSLTFQDKSLFYHAVASSNLAVVKLFVKSGFNIDNERESDLLAMVAAKGNAPLFRYLIDLGLRPDGRDSLRNTPLMLAASRGHESIVDLLLKMEVNTKTRNRDGDTAEELALRAGFQEIANNISKSDNSGFLGGF